MRSWFEKHLISLVFGFIGSIFALIGGGFLWGYFYTQQEARITEQIPLYTTAQLANTSSGTLVVVEGRMSEQNTSHFAGLVAYTAHQYQGVECDDDNDCKQLWRETERVTPSLWLDLPDGRVRVGNTDYDLVNAPEVWQNTSTLIEYSTLEYRGFRRGNPVFVKGQAETNDGIVLKANFLYGGSRQDYLAGRSDEAMTLLWLGGVFAGFGLLFLTVAVVVAVFIS